MKKVYTFFYSSILVAMILMYQNCGIKMRSSGLYSEVTLTSKCDAEMKSYYQGGFLPFFKSTCIGCHTTKDQQGGHFLFLSNDLDTAYDTFKNRPLDRYNNQIKTNHNGTYSESDKSTVADLIVKWNKKLEACGKDGVIVDEKSANTGEIQTHLLAHVSSGNNADCYKGISDSVTASYLDAVPAEGKSTKVETLSWDLGKSRADLAGVTIKVDILITSTSLPTPEDTVPAGTYCPAVGYEYGNIRFDTNKKINVKNINVLLNNSVHGRAPDVPNGLEIAPGSNVPISFGSGMTPMTVNYFQLNDKWKVIIEEVSVVQ